MRSVSQLTREIRDLLERRLGDIWVRGEVSNLRPHRASGHTWFTLKDADAQLRCVLFRGDRGSGDFPLQEGLDIQAFGRLSVYEARGDYQLIVRHYLEAGEGRLQAEFQRLKNKLKAEGLFDSERKRPLPELPKRIALITSASGVAWRDFLAVFRRRRWRGELILLPAAVQGREAPAQIIRQLARLPEIEGIALAVITRGGGSAEDLWCFNDEGVVRAVAACPVPTLSAIGHETDFTLTDFAADARAETPTGAAERVTAAWAEVRNLVGELERRLHRLTEEGLERTAERLKRLGRLLRAYDPGRLVDRQKLRLAGDSARLDAATDDALRDRHKRAGQLHQRLVRVRPERLLAQARQRVDREHGRLSRVAWQNLQAPRQRLASVCGRLSRIAPATLLAAADERCESRQRALDERANRALLRWKARLEQAEVRLRALDLQKTLERGFVILRNSDGSLIGSSRAARPGQPFLARFADGERPGRFEAELKPDDAPRLD